MTCTYEEKKKELKNQMCIIALSGKGNTGKTQCLQKLIYEINKTKHVTCIYPNNLNKFKELIKKGDPVINDKNNMSDFIVIVETQEKTVGIITYGDNEESLIYSFYMLKDYDCDLYICACRSYGKTIALLEELTESGKLIVHNRWAISEDSYRRKSMEYQVEEIINEMEDLLI